jgi:hypothetical protein
MALGAALTGLQPALQGLVNGWAEGKKQEETAQATADAELAALKGNINSWADAVRENPALADKSPYYRGIYEGRFARAAVQRRSNEIFSEYWRSTAPTMTSHHSNQY